MEYKQVVFFLSLSFLLLLVSARPDGGEQPPLPGPGLSYGGIPYGSMTGNVAEYFEQSAPSSHNRQLVSNSLNVDYAPVAPYF